MRDILQRSFPTLVWIVTGATVLAVLLGGLMMVNISGMMPSGGALMVVLSILSMFLGLVATFLFAALCFMLADIRTYTKHAALELRRLNQR